MDLRDEGLMVVLLLVLMEGRKEGQMEVLKEDH
jgi:hypothetical protein